LGQNVDANTRRTGILAALIALTAFCVVGFVLLAVSYRSKASAGREEQKREKTQLAKSNPKQKSTPDKPPETAAAYDQQRTTGPSASEEAAEAAVRIVNGIVSLVIGAATVVGIGLLIYKLIGWLSRCPWCRRSFAREHVKTEEISRIYGYGLVTRTAHTQGTSHTSSAHTGRPTTNSQSQSTTKWKERVPVIRITLRHDYKCKHCPHTWSETENLVKEDFSRN
jgi:hypothetical protein